MVYPGLCIHGHYRKACTQLTTEGELTISGVSFLEAVELNLNFSLLCFFLFYFFVFGDLISTFRILKPTSERFKDI